MLASGLSLKRIERAGIFTALTRLVRSKLLYILFGIFMAIACVIRFWVAPLSASPDVAQFWAFARVFQLEGLNFYHYAEATADIFPYKLWGYVYPPFWLFVLRVCLWAVPGAYATETTVDTTWRLAIKTPIILSDLAIGFLLFWAVPGSRRKKLIFASLWLFHPTAWYESAIFGQFDALAAAFLIASLIMVVKQRDGLAFVFAGLALTIKQHAFILIAGLLAVDFHLYRWSSMVRKGIILTAPFAALSIPFLMNGNLTSYLHSVFFPAQSVGYQYPLNYACSGTGSLLTYLHNVLGWETINILKWSTGVTALLLVLVLGVSCWKQVNPLQASLASFLVFVALFYRVNYQYLIIYIPVALLVAAMTIYQAEKVIALALALFPAVWLWLFDISYWFNYMKPASQSVTPFLSDIYMTELREPWTYVIFATTLMCLSLLYTGLVLTRWHGWSVKTGKTITYENNDNRTNQTHSRS